MRAHNGSPGKPALPYRTRGLLPSHPTSTLQRKAPLTKNLSLKGYLKSTVLGISGSTTYKTRRRRSSASFSIPNLPRIPLARPTPPQTFKGSCTTDTPCIQRHSGAAPRCHQQSPSWRTNLLIPLEDSWITWRPLRPTTRLF